MTKKFFLYAIAALGALQSAAAQPRLIVQIVVGSMRGECSVSDTSAIVEYDDFCKSLKKAMKNLSSTQREVIECVKLNQMSVKETAVKLRLKEQTVKNALSAGLKVLKEILKKSLVLILSFVLK